MKLHKSNLLLSVFLFSIILFLIGVATFNGGKNYFNIAFSLTLFFCLLIRMPALLNLSYVKTSSVHFLIIIYAILYLFGLEDISRLESYIGIVRLIIVFYSSFFIAKYICKINNKHLFYVSLLLLAFSLIYIGKSLTMSYTRLTFIGQSNTTAQVFYMMVVFNIAILMKIKRHRYINYFSILLLCYLAIESGSRTIMIAMPVLLFLLFSILNYKIKISKSTCAKAIVIIIIGACFYYWLVSVSGMNLTSKRFLTYLTYSEFFLSEFKSSYLFGYVDKDVIEAFFLNKWLLHPVYQVPHNSLLIILVNSGLFSMLVYLLLHIVLILNMIYVHKVYFGNRLSAFSVASAISCFIIGLVENSFVGVNLLYSYYFYAIAAVFLYVKYFPSVFKGKVNES